jgi:PAS domain S-box-containing protein
VATEIRVRIRRLVFAILCVLAAAGVRIALDPWLGHSVPYLMFYPAVVVAAWYGGFGSGVVATGLSSAAAIFRYLTPIGAFSVADAGDALSLIFFAVNGVLLSALGQRVLSAEIDQQRFAAIVESSHDAIVAKTLDGVITAWNHGAERLFGYTAGEALGQPIMTIVPDDRRDEEARVLANIRAGRRVEPFETLRRRKDGTLVDVWVTISPIRDRTGAIVGASTIASDITARKRVEQMREELIERERLAHDDAVAARDRLAFLAEVGTLLTSSLDYEETLDRAVRLALPRLGDYCNVLVQDEHGELRHVAWGHVIREKEQIVRALAERLLEQPSSGAITFTDTILKTGRTTVLSHAQVEAAASTQIAGLDAETVRLARDLAPHAYVGAPLRVRGRVVGVMSFGTTGTESRREYAPADIELVEEFARRASVAIENARLFRHADELNRLKDEFLATLSHEMRTPLNAVLGWSRMLASGNLDEARLAQAVHAIERNAQAQSKIVDDILDVARGMSGNVKLDLKPLDLAAVAHRAVEAIVPAAVAKKIVVDVQAREAVPISGDPARLQQVVWNLLSNAVKFTPSGGRVTVNVLAVNDHAELQVADTGVGIPRSFLPFVFDKFRQADASFTRQHGGLGLGLAIARHLIELHGGSIEARSAGEGAGATFVVQLPSPVRDAAR